MQIHIPNSAFIGNIDPFLRKFDNSNPTILNITSNKKWISIHPVVLAMIGALGLSTKKVTCDDLQAKSKHYLERMNLFKLLGIQSPMKIEKHEPAGRFIPLKRIKNSDDLSYFITELVPLLHLLPNQADPTKYVVSEMVRNVLEHARSKHGAIICAQYYQKSNTIRIGIADTGIGISESIRNSHLAKDDISAIRLALMPGITGTTRNECGSEFNAGAGLFFTKSIAKVNGNFFMIYSGNAMYKLLKDEPRLHGDPFMDKHSTATDLPYWKGTVIGIDINMESTKAFSHLLDMIHDTFLKTIRDRKKQKIRRPKFI